MITQEDSSRLVCFFMNSKMEKVPKSTVSFLDAPKHKLKLMLVKFEKASICIYNILIFSGKNEFYNNYTFFTSTSDRSDEN